jgi:hypothetical protein
VHVFHGTRMVQGMSSPLMVGNLVLRGVAAAAGETPAIDWAELSW